MSSDDSLETFKKIHFLNVQHSVLQPSYNGQRKADH